MASPAFSVDVAALCGLLDIDTVANESDLVSSSQEEPCLLVSALARTKHTSINILASFFYLDIQHDFCLGGKKKRNIGEDGRRERKQGEGGGGVGWGQ